MDISSFILLSHEQALRRRLDVSANNMANASTTGFQRERPVFHEYVQKAEDAMVPDARAASFVLDYRTAQDTRSGHFEATGNPLDVMIDGKGYFAVEAPGGGTAYTRAGFIKVGDSGDLVTSGGQRILDDGGRPITIPPDAVATLTIGADGTVLSRNGPLGRIGVNVFGNDGALTPRGDGMMDGTGARVLDATETRLRSGGVEGSNVQPIVETTELVDILRSYQSSIRIAEAINDMRTRAIQRLGRIG